MYKYLIRGTIAAGGIVFFSMGIYTQYHSSQTFFEKVNVVITIFVMGVFIMEFFTCLISYHHALWTNDQSDTPDGTR